MMRLHLRRSHWRYLICGSVRMCHYLRSTEKGTWNPWHNYSLKILGSKLLFKPKLHNGALLRLVCKRTLTERSIVHWVQTPPYSLDFNISNPVAWCWHKSSGTAFAIKGRVSILWLNHRGSDQSLHQKQTFSHFHAKRRDSPLHNLQVLPSWWSELFPEQDAGCIAAEAAHSPWCRKPHKVLLQELGAQDLQDWEVAVIELCQCEGVAQGMAAMMMKKVIYTSFECIIPFADDVDTGHRNPADQRS